MRTIEDFEEIQVISEDGRVRVVLEWLGEGHNGDYQTEDPEDEPLVRFSVYRKYLPDEEMAPHFLDDVTPVAFTSEDWGWRAVADGSYCTQLPATLPKEKLLQAAQAILNQVEGDISSQVRCKKLLEQLSWLGPDDLN